MILNLPTDLAENILSRLPLKSIRSIRLTCKKWNALSKTQSFRKLRIGKLAAKSREGESQMIATMYHNVHLMSVVVDDDATSTTERKGKLTCLNLNDSKKRQVKITRVFHCDGLLLCVLKNKSKLVVWNPYTGETRWIGTEEYGRDDESEHKTDEESENETDDESENETDDEPEEDTGEKHKYALGYVKKNQSCRSHKIVKFKVYLYPIHEILWYEIYDLDSDSWKTLHVIPEWRLVCDDFGVSINGKTYWCACERSREGVVENLVCLDFTKERFGPLLPLPFRAGSDVTLSSVRDEKISVMFRKHQPSYRIEIWISSKIVEADAEMSWSKFFTVDTGPLVDIPGYSFTNGTYFVDEEKKVAMVIDENKYKPKKYDAVNIAGEGGYFREVDLRRPANGEEWCWPHVYFYSPSSVKI